MEKNSKIENYLNLKLNFNSDFCRLCKNYKYIKGLCIFCNSDTKNEITFDENDISLIIENLNIEEIKHEHKRISDLLNNKNIKKRKLYKDLHFDISSIENIEKQKYICEKYGSNLIDILYNEKIKNIEKTKFLSKYYTNLINDQTHFSQMKSIEIKNEIN